MIENLRTASIDAEYWITQYIGEVYYNSIKAKNNVALTQIEDLIVRAEIYAIAAEFLWLVKNVDNSSNQYSNASVADVSIANSNTNNTGIDSSAISYKEKAKYYLNLAGYNTVKRVTHGLPTTTYAQFEVVNAYEGIQLDWPDKYK